MGLRGGIEGRAIEVLEERGGGGGGDGGRCDGGSSGGASVFFELFFIFNFDFNFCRFSSQHDASLCFSGERS